MKINLSHLGCLVIAATMLGARPVEIPSPASSGALGPSLATSANGSILLSWLQPAGDDAWKLQFARFDPKAAAWSPATTIAQGRNWFVNWADFPQLAPLGGSSVMAVWFVNNPPAPHAHGGHHGPGYHAVYSLSEDDGRTWSSPQPITGESTSTEFVALLPLGENRRALAAWLDGRARTAGGDQQALYAQTFLARGPDQLVDERVCDCCQLSLVPVTDGALLAYRGRSEDEVRDIRLARWSGGRWQSPQSLHDDGWKIAACPVNGPRLAARGSTVAAAWYTAAQAQPRVQVKLSRDGGATWGNAVRVDLGRPQGRVDCLLGEAGTALVTWLELTGEEGTRDGGIYLREIRADGTAGPPRLLAATSTARASGFPRLAPLPDGRLLLACTLEGEESRIATLLVTLD